MHCFNDCPFHHQDDCKVGSHLILAESGFPGLKDAAGLGSYQRNPIIRQITVQTTTLQSSWVHHAIPCHLPASTISACNRVPHLLAWKCVASVAEWSRRLSVAQEITGSNPVARPKTSGKPRSIALNSSSACSSMDRALGFGPRGCGFESCQARHYQPPVPLPFHVIRPGQWRGFVQRRPPLR